MEEKEELRAKYKALLGKKPHHKLSIDSLKEAIENEENQISSNPEDAGDSGSQTRTESNRKITPDEEIEKEIRSSQKVKDGKRHLVYKDGKEVWWSEHVIKVMMKSFPDRISFPENTQFIAPNLKTCTDCG